MKYADVASPKIEALADELGIEMPHATGLVLWLEAAVASHWPLGSIHGVTIPRLAKRCGWEGDPEKFFKAMLKAKILRQNKPGEELRLVDWDLNCPQYVARRAAREERRRAGG